MNIFKKKNEEIEKRLYLLETKMDGVQFRLNQIDKILGANGTPNEPAKPTFRKLYDNYLLINNMCLSYNHSFGLMDKEDQELLRFQCREWLRAFENNKDYCNV